MTIMYLAIVSRPDIAHAVNSVSKFLNRHNNSHWRAVKRPCNYRIKYYSGGSEVDFTSYSDSDYANDLEPRRSTSGYLFYLVNGPVTWSLQRQKLVTLSTTESEYVAAVAAAKEAVWFRKLLSDIDCHDHSSTILYVDDQSTIKLG